MDMVWIGGESVCKVLSALLFLIGGGTDLFGFVRL